MAIIFWRDFAFVVFSIARIESMAKKTFQHLGRG